MKPYTLLAATLSLLCGITACNSDSDDTLATPTIVLTNPADRAKVDLTTGTTTTFGWTAVEGISEYTLVMSLSEELSSPQTLPLTDNPFYLSATDFDAIAERLGIREAEQCTVYWSVTAPAGQPVQNQVRTIELTRNVAQPSAIELLSPEENALIDLNDNQTTIEFSWTKLAEITQYTILFSLTETMSDPVSIDVGDLGSLRYTRVEEFDDVLSDLGLRPGEQKIIYWSVSPTEENTQIETQIRSLRIQRIAQSLIRPEKGSSIELLYTFEDEEAPAPVVFEWGDRGASSYELVFSTRQDLSDPVSVQGIQTASRSFSHTELQELLIEPDAFGLKRYKPNTLYWNIKADGEWISDEPGEFILNGMMVFIDRRNNGQEVQVYRVANIHTTGYEATWMADDLRTSYSSDGRDLTQLTEDSGNEYNQFAGPGRTYEGQAAAPATQKIIPAYFQQLNTMYYRCSVSTAEYLSTAEWKLPTLAEWKALFDAACQTCENGECFVLRDYDRYGPDEQGNPTFDYTYAPERDQWNTWKMNMGPNGHFCYGYNTYVYFNWTQDFGGSGNSAHEIYYAYDYLGDSSQNGKFFYFWTVGNPPYGPDGSTGWWGTNNSLVPSRLIYKGR